MKITIAESHLSLSAVITDFYRHGAFIKPKIILNLMKELHSFAEMKTLALGSCIDRS